MNQVLLFKAILCLIVASFIIGCNSDDNDIQVSTMNFELNPGEDLRAPIHGLAIEDEIMIIKHPSEFSISKLEINESNSTLDYIFVPNPNQSGNFEVEILIKMSPGGTNDITEAITRILITIND